MSKYPRTHFAWWWREGRELQAWTTIKPAEVTCRPCIRAMLRVPGPGSHGVAVYRIVPGRWDAVIAAADPILRERLAQPWP